MKRGIPLTVPISPPFSSPPGRTERGPRDGVLRREVMLVPQPWLKPEELLRGVREERTSSEIFFMFGLDVFQP